MLKKLLKTLTVVALVLSTNTIANNYDDYGVDFIKIDMSALDTSTTAMTLSFNESSEWINPLLSNAQSKIIKNVARYKIALKKSSKEEIVF